jgi:hypothetical protein
MMLTSHGEVIREHEDHHGIVMDCARRNLKQSDWKDPGEPVIAALIAGNGLWKSWE